MVRRPSARLIPAAVLGLVVAGCGDTAATTTGPAPPTATVAPTTSTASTGTAPERTTTAPSATGSTTTAAPSTTVPVQTEEPTTMAVVLVASDDVLNVRAGPGTEFEVVDTLAPTARDVPTTGRFAIVAGSKWIELDAGTNVGWANGFFLTPQVDGVEFADDPRVEDLLDGLAAVMASRRDLNSVSSRRGLFMARLEPPERWEPNELTGALTDPTPLEWPGTGCSPEECPKLTFAEAVADSFVSTYDDPDRLTVPNGHLSGGNGILESVVVPTEFSNFNWMVVHDPGDNPDFGGLDWETWYVMVDYEVGEPVVIGMVYNAWHP